MNRTLLAIGMLVAALVTLAPTASADDQVEVCHTQTSGGYTTTDCVIRQQGTGFCIFYHWDSAGHESCQYWVEV